MADREEVVKEEGVEDAEKKGVGVKREESREEMLSRHRKEIEQLQKKEVEMKKAAARGSKAEQKAKKKQVEEEITRLSAKLKEKHAEELASLGYIWGAGAGAGAGPGPASNGSENKSLDNLVMAVAGVSVSAGQREHGKPSKSAKRREKRAQQEAQREQRIQEEQSNIVSDRMVENDQLAKKLQPLGLVVYEIKPDGNCLYRAVAHQLALLSAPSSPTTYQDLRKMVAAYMRDNTTEFLPFFIQGDSSDSIAERFEDYCKEIESTSAWGGQLELQALTHCLKKHIIIYSGLFPDVEMGKEYKSGGGNGLSSATIMLSYHKHAFGLGEHYNSVVPV